MIVKFNLLPLGTIVPKVKERLNGSGWLSLPSSIFKGGLKAGMPLDQIIKTIDSVSWINGSSNSILEWIEFEALEAAAAASIEKEIELLTVLGRKVPTLEPEFGKVLGQYVPIQDTNFGYLSDGTYRPYRREPLSGIEYRRLAASGIRA